MRTTILHRASIALSAILLACAESTSPNNVVAPFDASVQPVLTATSSVSGAPGNEVIRVDVVMTNPDVLPRRFTKRGPCFLFLRLYSTPDRTGTPAYRDFTEPGGCKSFDLPPDTLAAHASIAYWATSTPVMYSPSAPNGQRIPPGRYYAAVNVSILELVPGTSTLPAGEVVLAAP